MSEAPDVLSTLQAVYYLEEESHELYAKLDSSVNGYPPAPERIEKARERIGRAVAAHGKAMEYLRDLIAAASRKEIVNAGAPSEASNG